VQPDVCVGEESSDVASRTLRGAPEKRATAAASTPDPQDLYQAQLDLLLDPDDPASGSAGPGGPLIAVRLHILHHAAAPCL